MKRKFLTIIFIFLMISLSFHLKFKNKIFAKEKSSTSEENVVVKLNDTSILSSLKNKKLKFHFEYMLNDNLEKKEDKSFFFENSENEKTFKIDFPKENMKGLSLVTDIEDFDVDTNISSSFPENGKLIFEIEAFKTKNTNISVVYKDIYKNSLSFKLPKDKEFKISFDNESTSLNLPKSDVEFNLKTVDESIFSKSDLEKLTDILTLENLKKEINLSIDDKIEGEFDLDKEKYKFNIKKEKDMHVIEITYLPKFVKVIKDGEKYPDTPKGYVRLTFKADGKYKKDWKDKNETETEQKGDFELSDKKEYLLDVRDDLKFSDTDLKEMLENFKKSDDDEKNKDRFLPLPLKENSLEYDDKKSFMDFFDSKKSLVEYKDEKVSDKTFYARYSVNGKTVPVGEKVSFNKILFLCIFLTFIISFILLKSVRKYNFK